MLTFIKLIIAIRLSYFSLVSLGKRDRKSTFLVKISVQKLNYWSLFTSNITFEFDDFQLLFPHPLLMLEISSHLLEGRHRVECFPNFDKLNALVWIWENRNHIFPFEYFLAEKIAAVLRQQKVLWLNMNTVKMRSELLLVIVHNYKQ